MKWRGADAPGTRTEKWGGAQTNPIFDARWGALPLHMHRKGQIDEKSLPLLLTATPFHSCAPPHQFILSVYIAQPPHPSPHRCTCKWNVLGKPRVQNRCTTPKHFICTWNVKSVGSSCCASSMQRRCKKWSVWSVMEWSKRCEVVKNVGKLMIWCTLYRKKVMKRLEVWISVSSLWHALGSKLPVRFSSRSF